MNKQIIIDYEEYLTLEHINKIHMNEMNKLRNCVVIPEEEYEKIKQENKELKERYFCKYADKCEEIDCTREEYQTMAECNMRLSLENKELHNKIDKAIKYMNGEEFFLLMNSIQTPDKAVCEDYFKAKGNLLEILKDSDVDDR